MQPANDPAEDSPKRSSTNADIRPGSIGRPLAGGRSYVLDRALCPVMPGGIGELYLAGPQLARGYVNDPGLTAARFVADPFGPPGSRMYRTGDLARRRADGELEFAGRSDEQLKVRGFRVEPGAVEAVLARLPGVGQVAVVGLPDESGVVRLIAYVTLQPGHLPDPAELRRQAAAVLPDYQVPSSIEVLDRLPLNANGKLDRRALPAPVATVAKREIRSPRNAREAMLCELFAEVLNVPEVGIDDDFFELGGHSLQATRLAGRIRTRIGVVFPLRILLGRHTVAEIAETIEEAHRAARPEIAPARVDLRAEAALDPEIAVDGRLPMTPNAITCPSRVLLTGGTGFLGAFLLRELLDRGVAQVHCLVRAATESEGMRRIRQMLVRYRIWDDTFAERIVPVPGDLEQPLLGLSVDRFRALAQLADAIYHNGAKVNVVDPYSRLSAANVQGTREVLKLASTHRIKPVHYISTAGVAIARDANPPLLPEDRRVEADRVLLGGYVGTKWVAEELVRAAGERGIPVAIYRPGRIGGHTDTGVCAPEDAVWTAVRAMIQLGAAPDRGPMVEMDLAPVDYVAAAIAHLSRCEDSLGTVFHLTNPRQATLADLVRHLRRLGYRMASMSGQDWEVRLAELAERAAAQGDHSLDPAVLLGAGLLAGADGMRFDDENTRRGLAGSAIACPEVGFETIARCVSHLVESGHLPAPSQSERQVPAGEQSIR